MSEASEQAQSQSDAAIEQTFRDGVESFRGELIFPGGGDYEEARKVWNLLFDRRPAVIGRCRDHDDVVTMVRLARDHNLPIAVRSGGHSYAGHSTCDGGVVIDLSRMKGFTLHADRGVANAEPGLTWGELNDAAGEHGLAAVGGHVSSVGVAGLTLGGGIGWLDRVHGLACDNVAEFEVVTASGSVLTASADEHSDLYWALRGGGGNFGIVTRFTFQLHRVGSVFGGLVMYSGEHTDQILRSLLDFGADAPDSVHVAAGLLTAPPEPFVPPDLQGRPAVLLAACHVGRESAGEQALAPLREFGEPRVDMLTSMPFTQLQHLFDGMVATPMPVYMKSELLGGLDGPAADEMAGALAAVPSPVSNMLLIPLGGAVQAVPSEDTAFAHRGADWSMEVGASWLATDDAHACRQWADASWQRMRSWSAGVQVNHLRDEGPSRVREAYPEETYARLNEIKRHYDPENVFSLNHNIEPARSSTATT